MSHKSQTTKQPPEATPPFSRRCRRCGRPDVALVTMPYEVEVRHDGRLYQLTIPKLELPICQTCGEKVFTESVDVQVTDALRSHLHLLTPAQIRAGIERVGMSQKEFAARLGIAEATLSRWLNETQIQSRALDNLLRAYLAFPSLRQALCAPFQDPEFGLRDWVSNVNPSSGMPMP